MEQQERVSTLTNTMAKFIGLIGKQLPTDVIEKLIELREKETSELGKVVYDVMFYNLEKAIELDRPACQDTGVINFFIKAGRNFPFLLELKEILPEAVKIATKEVPLRHNAVEIFDEINTGNNVGERAPFIHWEIVDNSNQVEIEAYMSGGGCSLPGRATTLVPAAGYPYVLG